METIEDKLKAPRYQFNGRHAPPQPNVKGADLRDAPERQEKTDSAKSTRFERIVAGMFIGALILTGFGGWAMTISDAVWTRPQRERWIAKIDRDTAATEALTRAVESQKRALAASEDIFEAKVQRYENASLRFSLGLPAISASAHPTTEVHVINRKDGSLW